MNHCIIGDVHGEYKALLNLISMTPLNSKIILVGDLIDRGEDSARVVQFVRQHNLASVRGNHEEMMIEHGGKFVEDIENDQEIEQENMWLTHGGKETLLSYGLVTIVNDKLVPHRFIKDFIFQFKEDIEWMKQLPIYIELKAEHNSGRSVVVSHSAIAPVWRLRESEEGKSSFENTVLWAKMKPIDSEPIFNVFGHTPQHYTADIQSHYVNIDTGAYNKSEKGLGLLSAYCLERNEVISATEFSYAKAM